ncbi:TIR domain-containing protein [Streptacidiphilus sp. 4-A2]|nr:TIR domain-containing protein [Streptacidiphilus sp. 4-A2]
MRRLFEDLCETIMEITPTPAEEPVGFMDRATDPAWTERLTRAVAHCRVFVPLYSPRYFDSPVCGQEWSAFAGRTAVQRRGGSGHQTGIVPVWWVPVPRGSLPPVASSLQFNHSDFGTDYLSNGMRALSLTDDYRDSYQLAVHRLAQRIVQVSESLAINPGPRQDFTTLPSAFTPPDPGESTGRQP